MLRHLLNWCVPASALRWGHLTVSDLWATVGRDGMAHIDSWGRVSLRGKVSVAGQEWPFTWRSMPAYRRMDEDA